MSYVWTALLSAIVGGYATWRFRARVQKIADWFNRFGNFPV